MLHMSSGKCKLKHRDTTTFLLKWPKFRKRTKTNADEDVKQEKLPLLVGIQNGAATLEDCLMVAYKTKPILTTQSSHCAPWYLPKGGENLCECLQQLYS